MYFIASLICLVVETLAIWILVPHTGVNYNPTFVESGVMAVLIDTVVSLAVFTYYLRLKNGD